jgi:hypothetical protein
MVSPITQEERDRSTRRLKAGSILLVALSAGLITLRTDAGLVGFGVAAAFGLVVGVVLVWFVAPNGLAEFR